MKKGYKNVMFMGSLLDILMTEPEKFNSLYVVTDEEDGRKKAYQDAKKEAEDSGRMLVKKTELATAERMSEAILGHPEGIKMVKGEPQRVFTSAVKILHPSIGEVWSAFKLKTDFTQENEDGTVDVWDLKVTGFSDDDGIAKVCRNLGYHWQEELYSSAINSTGRHVRSFKFVFVCEEAPHRVRVVEFNDEALHGARRGIQKAYSIVTAVAAGHSPAELESHKLVLGSKIERPHYWDTVNDIPNQFLADVRWA